MKSIKMLALAVALGACAVAQAESPVGGGKPNLSLDSTPCYTWSGNTSGAFWTRCPTPMPIEKIVTVEKIVPGPTVTIEKIVEKPVEKIVYVEGKPKGE